MIWRGILYGFLKNIGSTVIAGLSLCQARSRLFTIDGCTFVHAFLETRTLLKGRKNTDKRDRERRH